MFGRIIKRLLHRLVRGLIRARLLVVLLLGVLLVAGAIGGFQAAQAPGFSLAVPGAKRAPDSTENFLKGNQTYNAELVLNSLSDEAAERYRARVGGLQEMQRALDQARERGSKLEQIDYVGGHALPDGTSLQFYVVATRGAVARPELEYVTYTFTLDRSGKILKVQ